MVAFLGFLVGFLGFLFFFALLNLGNIRVFETNLLFFWFVYGLGVRFILKYV